MDDTPGPDLPIYVRDFLQTVAAVVLVGLLLFGATGVWPPMVAVESPSMEPHMTKGDLVVVTDAERFAGPAADEYGVVTSDASEGYSRFAEPGDVVVYDAPGNRGSPIIHRARFRVSDGENWYDRADPNHVPAGVDSCAELVNCPAPHDGYITLGDNNEMYDQVSGIASGPVRAEWVVAKAQIRVPYLGYIRLLLAGKA
ncbi:signal peptidase, endoplasmic reticulum-type [Halopelagius inordinatus]|uniref:Signal peptidase, endoplasmic reticulum-type n=1 Tax=Halopelagius inordinatus TaxID=553467 RepID=A0A1I2S4I2_9EURY|nr:S26 family signal peptidase [Halopelagius inordinatus]SFG47835.1 signal peptidase, endoplasmic reticulum-type [Halopelagius inordinatus]